MNTLPLSTGTGTLSWYPVPGATAIASNGSPLLMNPDDLPSNMAPVESNSPCPAGVRLNAKSKPTVARSVRTVLLSERSYADGV